MANAYSTERERSPLEIVHATLRDAALAPTVFDALDVARNALCRPSKLARAVTVASEAA